MGLVVDKVNKWHMHTMGLVVEKLINDYGGVRALHCDQVKCRFGRRRQRLSSPKKTIRELHSVVSHSRLHINEEQLSNVRRRGEAEVTGRHEHVR